MGVERKLVTMKIKYDDHGSGHRDHDHSEVPRPVKTDTNRLKYTLSPVYSAPSSVGDGILKQELLQKKRNLKILRLPQMMSHQPDALVPI